MRVYIGVGSNQGRRIENINRAFQLLEENGEEVRRISPLYENAAVCLPGEEMPEFVNGVFELETGRSPENLLNLLEDLERELGREGKGDRRPRPIDLDILFYGDQVLESRRLKVPHPEIERRWFVLKPLADLAPDLVHPILGKPVKELLQSLNRSL